eukprot:m.66985 g.66985  ORF g.66985 m.66985 type:complete len:1151 (+) comp13616_c0_seq2:529-3981(+)
MSRQPQSSNSGSQKSSQPSGRTTIERQSTLQSLTSAQLDSALFDHEEDERNSQSSRPSVAASQPPMSRQRVGSSATSDPQQRHTSLNLGRLATQPRTRLDNTKQMPTDMPEPPSEHPDVFSQRTAYVPEEDIIRKREADRQEEAEAQRRKSSMPADGGYISNLVTGVALDHIKVNLLRSSQTKGDFALPEEEEVDDDADDGNSDPGQYSRASGEGMKRMDTYKSHDGYSSDDLGDAIPRINYDVDPDAEDEYLAQLQYEQQLREQQQRAADSPSSAQRSQKSHTTASSYAIIAEDSASRADPRPPSHASASMNMGQGNVIILNPRPMDVTQRNDSSTSVGYTTDQIHKPSTLPRNATLEEANETAYSYASHQEDKLVTQPDPAFYDNVGIAKQYLSNGFDRNASGTYANSAADYHRASYRAPSREPSYRAISHEPSYRGPTEYSLKRRHFGKDSDRSFVAKAHKASTDGHIVIPDPHTLRSPVTTVYARHEDFYADTSKNYYVPDARKKRRMCCVIPCYNEPSDALRRTLTTLHSQLDNLRKLDFDFHAVIIMDGWQLTSESMRTYLQTVFDMPENVENEGPTWWDDLNVLEGNPSVETFIIQNVNIETWTVEPVFIEPEEMPGARMHITLIVKRDNRRKHNTLEWFFRSFAVEYGAEYSFTTDCGTLFEPDTIYHLAKHLDLFPRCGGVTGRQRVMSARQQGVDHEDWYSAWMRNVQGFEYEATYASYVGAFSMAGMLPVIPGPCGLFNMKHLAGQGVEFFFDKVKQDPDTAGLLLGNGLLAEDRFLSYAAVVSTGNPTITEFVPESVFYFEAETELKTFVFQRRRWNNGTFACFVWLMLNLDIIRKSPHGIVFKLLVQFLVIWQVMWLAVSLIAPALFLVLLRLGIRHTFPINEGGSSFWADMICVLYIALYVTFIVQHVASKFEAWLFHVFTFIHGLAVVFIISTFIHAAATRRDHVVDLTLYLFAVYQGAPIVLSMIVSPRSCGYLIRYFLPYMIFLPTHTMSFWTYALTRTFDLTWGNRPTTHKIPKNERNLIVDRLKAGSIGLVGLVATVNILIAIILLQIAVSGKTLWIIWTLVSLMVFSGVQMALSFGFAIEYHFFRRFRRWARKRRLNHARHRRKTQKKQAAEQNPNQSQLLEWDNTGIPR